MPEKIILKGIGSSQGVATGKVKVVSGAEDDENFIENDILVTTVTDPTMVMMMSRAAAIICDIGGITTHASIVSREMGIPCVVNAKTATTTLKDGMIVRVDGTKGEVYLVE